MGKKGLRLHKSLQTYLSKLKKVPSLHLPTSPRRHTKAAAAASRLLSACKYPKTPSFAMDRDCSHGGDASRHDRFGATLSDVDRFLHENFHSLYGRRGDNDGLEGYSSSESLGYGIDPPADVIRLSDRFFVSPGTTSNSLLDDTRHSGASSSTSSSPLPFGSNERPKLLGDGVPVMTFSKDPYDDFRRSMQDMVEARHVDPSQPRLDWDFMEELLFCYLELNERSVHKYILKAFTDLTVAFRRRAPVAHRRTPASHSKGTSKRTITEKGSQAAVSRRFRAHENNFVSS